MLRNPWLALAALVVFSAPAGANSGSAPPKDPMPSSSTPEAREAASPRQDAERLYGMAYDEVARARKDIETGKAKNAEKKFKKALDWSKRAVEFDPQYHEAWNLVGYSSRKLGQHDDAIDAYQKALAIKFDYAPAREYLGEAYLEKGQVAPAREQLKILERLKATAEAAELDKAIAAFVAAHPEAAQGTDATAAETTPAPAATDSSSAGKP